MAGPSSMKVSEAAGKILTGEHADVVREAARLVLAEFMRPRSQRLPAPLTTSAPRSASRSATAIGSSKMATTVSQNLTSQSAGPTGPVPCHDAVSRPVSLLGAHRS